MKELLKVLKRLVDNEGLTQVSAKLGHSNTIRLSRWIKNGSIPKGELGVVRTILKHEGVIQ